MQAGKPPYRETPLPSQAGQGEFLEKLLNGSQKKTAYALRQNAERMIQECPGGLASIGFMTLTVGDFTAGPMRPKEKRKFVQIWEPTEANRRINNLRGFLTTLFVCWIIVTERHKSGAIHFHLLGALRGNPDIRTGFDWDAVEKGDYSSVPERLKGIWDLLRERLPKYGFGRHELMPIRKTGQAVACYVAKYIEKNVCSRRPEDKRKKLVRYGGDWPETRMRPNDFSWANKRSTAWRCKTRQLAALVGVYFPVQAAEAFGPRWAYKLTRLWQGLGGEPSKDYLVWTFKQRELMRKELVRLSEGWTAREEAKCGRRRENYRPEEWDADKRQGFPEYVYGREYRDLGRFIEPFDYGSKCLESLILPENSPCVVAVAVNN